jgi:ribosomal protein S18 acetylase RimI-like enzyme
VARDRATDIHLISLSLPGLNGIDIYFADESSHFAGSVKHWGLGSHVCNAGYVTSPRARGKGVASAMCLHSQDEARAHGFRAMQFNIVVATNAGAVRLWQRLGFGIVGTLPGAFRHASLGYVDAYVMFKDLTR